MNRQVYILKNRGKGSLNDISESDLFKLVDESKEQEIQEIIDITTTAPLVGWATIDKKQIVVSKVGKQITVYFDIQGQSDASETTIEVPYPVAVSTTATCWNETDLDIRWGNVLLPAGFNVIIFCVDWLSSNFPNTGIKNISGSVTYLTT